ncbi:DUF2793 domain-containing protein [Sphingobium sp.]|uniref:DUF2793 domain-containing protein n=1 Tax=Sphingobium sp. TaxID=1912891 RepID=UPI002C928CA4|nr:DUF2793 domain-containing protein [Sphingobium sp.]HUD93438.1 DUF2793 domain-containing protein [Sphingobium sp.]
MDATPRWTLPLLYAGQAQKEIFHNEALVLVDALLHGVAESADLATPPGDPAVGRCWIVATGASGEWANCVGMIACWTEGGWRFVAPRCGLSLHVTDRSHALFHDGVEWRAPAVRNDGVYLDGVKVVGARAAAIAEATGGGVIDAEARLTIVAILAALRTHGLIDS